MPAQDKSDIKSEDTAYYHVYNLASDNKNLFNDAEDYKVFISFLQEYLIPRDKSDNAKKTFTIKGQIYRGLPHLPKNYFNKVELLGYSLLRNHFHLVVRQLKKGSLENLVRSLSTRYAIYFNKKYNRRGNLFAGRYKSIEIKDISSLLLLTRFIHKESFDQAGYSSYQDFINEKPSYWIKPHIITSYFNNSEREHFAGFFDYKNFTEAYQPNHDEEEIVKNIIIENVYETSRPTLPKIEETKSLEIIEVKAGKKTNPYPYIFASIIFFLILNGVAITNINLSQAKSVNTIALLPSPTPVQSVNPVSQHPSPSPQIAGVESEVLQKETFVIINITDGSKSVNLRKSASTDSPIIGQAIEGDVFEYVSENQGWYEIRLDTTTTAFVSATSAVLERKNI